MNQIDRPQAQTLDVTGVRFFLFSITPDSNCSVDETTLDFGGKPLAAFPTDPPVELCRRICGNLASICVIDTRTGHLRVGTGDYRPTRRQAFKSYIENMDADREPTLIAWDDLPLEDRPYSGDSRDFPLFAGDVA